MHPRRHNKKKTTAATTKGKAAPLDAAAQARRDRAAARSDRSTARSASTSKERAAASPPHRNSRSSSPIASPSYADAARFTVRAVQDAAPSRPPATRSQSVKDCSVGWCNNHQHKRASPPQHALLEWRTISNHPRRMQCQYSHAVPTKAATLPLPHPIIHTCIQWYPRFSKQQKYKNTIIYLCIQWYPRFSKQQI